MADAQIPLPTELVNPLAESIVQYGPPAIFAIFLLLAIGIYQQNRGQSIRAWQKESKATFWISLIMAVLLVPVILFGSLGSTIQAYSGVIELIPSNSRFQADQNNVYFLHRQSEAPGHTNVYWIYYPSAATTETSAAFNILYQVLERKKRANLTNNASFEQVLQTYNCRNISFEDEYAKKAKKGQIKLEVQRDSSEIRLVGVGRENDRLKFNCSLIPTSPDEERELAGGLVVPASYAGQSPRILDEWHWIARSHAQEKGDQAGPTKAAAIPEKELLQLFQSFNVADVRKGGEILFQNLDNYKPLINEILTNDYSPRVSREAAISAIRRYLSEKMDLEYPSPEELKFVSPLAIQRIILDGLDPSESIGLSSRRLLNSMRDARVEQAFSLVRQIFSRKSNPVFLSCFASYEMSVYVNWAFLNVAGKIPLGAPPAGAAVGTAVTQSEKWFDKAAQLKTSAVSAEDRVQFARIPYTRGAMLVDVVLKADDLGLTLAQKNAFLEQIRSSANAFEVERRNAGPNWSKYRYPWHEEIVASYLRSSSLSAFKGTIVQRPLPETTCEL